MFQIKTMESSPKRHFKLRECLNELSENDALILKQLDLELTHHQGLELRTLNSVPAADNLLCEFPNQADVAAALKHLQTAAEKISFPLRVELLFSNGLSVPWHELQKIYADPTRSIVAKGYDRTQTITCAELLLPLTIKSISSKAIRALSDVANLEFKPGLVCPSDTGTREETDTDIDIELALRSAASLELHCRRACELGFYETDFSELRATGVQAELDMLEATEGLNTYRGAIFSLGLLVAATAALSKSLAQPEAKSICRYVMRHWGPALTKAQNQKGAQKEASSGFLSVLSTSIPVYREYLHRTGDPTLAATQSLYTLIATLEDTHILSQGGPEGLEFAQKTAHWFLEGGGVSTTNWKTRAQAVVELFKARNLSPRASSHLLSATLYLANWP